MSDTPRASAGTGSSRNTEDRTPNTVLNGLIGGVVAIVLSFIPFSTVLGGAVAGYLEGGDYNAGGKAGGIAGVVAFLPFVAILAGLALFVPVMGGTGAGQQAAIWLMALLILTVSAVYTIGFGIVGGVIGVYLKREL